MNDDKSKVSSVTEKLDATKEQIEDAIDAVKEKVSEKLDA
jgi:hypothetical protein